ncbi:MAG: transcriptional repressor [Deltaproteobacteria bacterium]|nr:transcriptional repressor [Deltaproteobacteria bacterium]
MINDNYLEKENFKTLIESDDIGRVEDRLNVIDTFLSTEEHVTLEEFMGLLKDRGFDYEPDFVRLCLNRWVAHGFAQKKQFEGQPPRYEHHHLGKHHDHLICTKCGKIVEFRNDELERLQMRIAAERNFHMLQHKMEIYGLCSECMAKRSPLIPLDTARTGERVIIKEIIGGRGMKGRLASMGYRIGDVLEVISNDGQGRLIVGHGNIRLAIGRGVAAKLIVALV